MLTLTIASGGRPPGPDDGREVNVWRSHTGQPFARLFTGAARRWVDWPGVGVFVFSPGAPSVDVWVAPGATPQAVRDAYIRAIQPAALQAAPGWQALHAGAALVDAGVLVFCGQSGSGKSTLAYAFGRAGFTQFADDAVVMKIGTGVLAAGLPFTVRLRHGSADHFDARGSQPSPTLPAHAPVRAFFLLSQDAQCAVPRVEPIAPAEAFARLLTHAHCFNPDDPDESRRLTEDYLTLARVVPVFAMRYSPELRALDALIDAAVSAARCGKVEPVSR
jgi:hypothetical protein